MPDWHVLIQFDLLMISLCDFLVCQSWPAYQAVTYTD